MRATEHKPNIHLASDAEKRVAAAYEELVQRFVKWAEGEPEIRAAIVLGSRARVDRPADEWADLDVVVVTTDPERYIEGSGWVRNVGKPLLTFTEPTATRDEMERRVLFEDMLDVDFAIFPQRRVEQILSEGISQESATRLANSLGRGIRVLLDKDGIAAKLQALAASVKAPAPEPPTESKFLQVVNDFLYHAVFTAKHMRRGELWWAKMCSDGYMQELLLRMVEWHAHATRGWTYDTWFRGRFLEEWADPRVLEDLRKAFAHYDEADVKRGLLELMSLFRWVAIETAEKLGYSYPRVVDEKIDDWIRGCLNMRGQP